MIGEIPMTVEMLKMITTSHSGELEEVPQNSVFWGDTLTSQGSLQFKSGNSYQGRLMDGLMHGQGVYRWTDGVVYEGDFHKNQIRGSGSYLWPDGSTYTGDVKSSLRDGKGRFKSEKNGVEYEGEWKNGLKHGQGTVRYKSGAVYTGEFKFGFKHGIGQMTYPSGNQYKGSYKFDKKSGYGVMTWKNLQEVYRGFWEGDQQNGFGEHLWLESPGKSKSLRNRYEGMFFQGERHGFGTFYYSDGTRYEGEWVHNSKEGFAIFVDATGDMIESIFKADRLLQRLNKPKELKLIRFVSDVTESSAEDSSEMLGDGRSSNRRRRQGDAAKPRLSTQTSPRTLLRGASIMLSRMAGKGGSRNEPSTKRKPQERQGRSRPASRAPAGRKNSSTKRKEKDQKKSKKGTKETQVPGSSSKRANLSAEFIKRNQVNEISNPYIKILRVDDLLVRVKPKQRDQVLNSLEIVMLRYNTIFVSLYKKYRAFKENINEYSFTLKLRTMWRFLKHCRILTPTLTLGRFNQEFFKNSFNVFDLHFNYEKLRTKIKDIKLKFYGNSARKMEMLKKLDVYLRNHYVDPSRPRIDFNNYERSMKQIEEAIDSAFEKDVVSEKIKADIRFMEVPRFEIHDPKNIILFRNFIDGIIRAIYIRENLKFEKIADAIERYVIYRIKPLAYEGQFLFENMFSEKFEEGVQALIRAKKVEEDPVIRTVFIQNLKGRYNGNLPESKRDETTSVRNMLRLLERAGLVVSDQDKELLFDIIERWMDPDSTYKEVRNNYLKKVPILLNSDDSLALTGLSLDNDLKQNGVDTALVANSALNSDLEVGMRFGAGNELGGLGTGRTNTGDVTGTASDQRDNASNLSDVSLVKDEVEGGERKNGKPPDVPELIRGMSEAMKKEILKQNEAYKKSEMVKREGLIGDVDRVIKFEETQKRREMYDRELAVQLNKLLGLEMLYFEFVESLILYLTQKIDLNEKNFDQKFEEVKTKLKGAGRAVRKNPRTCRSKWPQTAKDKDYLKNKTRKVFDKFWEREKNRFAKTGKEIEQEELENLNKNDVDLDKLLEELKKEAKRKAKEEKKLEKKMKQERKKKLAARKKEEKARKKEALKKGNGKK